MQNSGRSEIQQDILLAQQIIVGRLREAWYIFPNDITFNLGGGSLRMNPTGGSGVWKIGAVTTAALGATSQPILAMVLPPSDRSGGCVLPTADNPPNPNGEGDETTPPATAGTGGDNSGCYRFFAYYAVKRSQWLSGTGSTSTNNPGADKNNEDVWVLAEYRDFYYPKTDGKLPTIAEMQANTPGISTSSALPSSANRSKAYLLADYVAPSAKTASFVDDSNKYNMFQLVPSTASVTVPVTGVTINLAAARQISGKLVRLPNATDEYSITVYPTNLGKIPAN